MTPRDRTRAALSFANPDRTPRHLWVPPDVAVSQAEAVRRLTARYPPDLVTVQQRPGVPNPWLNLFETPGSYRDEWGSEWAGAGPGTVGEMVRPALESWDAPAPFEPPWETLDAVDLDHIDRQCAAESRYCLSAVTARPFERLQCLRGSEALLIDLAWPEDGLTALLAQVHDYYRQLVARWCQSAVDGIVLMDDWGTGRGLLVNPDLWRAVFRPLYADYCDLIHGAGKQVFFHSDGDITVIVADLIAIGVDALNAQLSHLDLATVAATARGRLTWWGGLDTPTLLACPTPAAAHAAATQLRTGLADPRGGFIAQCEWAPTADPAILAAFFEAWEG